MEYPYPEDFPRESRAAVLAEKLRASRDFTAAKKKARSTTEIEAELRKYILLVFLVFAQEAFKLGRNTLWAVDEVESQAEEFLRWFVIVAWGEKGYDKAGNPITSVTDHWGSISPEVRRELEESAEWGRYEAGLREVAEIQAAGDVDLELGLSSDAGLSAPAETKTETIQSEGVDEIRAKRRSLLAEYKAATKNPSNKQLYEARNSGIHKPDFYAWLNGKLPSESAMSINFERFLRLRKPPIPRRPKG
jgi:hypothetical protein